MSLYEAYFVWLPTMYFQYAVLHSLLHGRAEETQQGRNSCSRLQFGFQFGLYRVIAPLSFQRSISLASLFTSLSIFGWSDLLQILRKQAAFSFAVLCIIMFCWKLYIPTDLILLSQIAIDAKNHDN